MVLERPMASRIFINGEIVSHVSAQPKEYLNCTAWGNPAVKTEWSAYDAKAFTLLKPNLLVVEKVASKVTATCRAVQPDTDYTAEKTITVTISECKNSFFP